LKRIEADQAELVILLGRGEPTLESVVDASNLALFCTPAVNLFHKRADRITSATAPRVSRRRRPDAALDFEIYQVTNVVGHGIATESEQEFLPFYSAYSSDLDHQQSAYYTTAARARLGFGHREAPRLQSGYIGTEVFLALVDAAQAPFSGDLRQLSIQALCTNRDLVLQMPMGIGTTDLSLTWRSGGEHPRVERPSAAGIGPLATAPCRARRSVICRSTIVARAIDAGGRGCGACAIFSSSTRRAPT